MTKSRWLALIERALRWAFQEPGLVISTVHLEETITFGLDGARWRYRIVDYSQPYGCRVNLMGSYVWSHDVIAAVERVMDRCAERRSKTA